MDLRPAHWHQGDLLGFDLETTGVERFRDVPVSMALVRVRAGRVVACDRRLIDPGRDIPAESVAVHGITTAEARRRGIPLEQALTVVADALLAAGARRLPVCGMRLDFDLTMVDNLCRRNGGSGLVARGWRGPVLDCSVIDRQLDQRRPGPRTLGDLCAHYGVELEQAHDAGSDALASVEVLRAMAARFPLLAAAPATLLHRWQISWHRQWATSFSRWRQGQGLAPLGHDELAWPVATWGGAGTSAAA